MSSPVRVRAPRFVPGTWFNTDHPLDAGAAARPFRAARLLDLLLRQLPARAGRAAPARARVRRRAHGHRRALAEVRPRARRRGGTRRRRAVRGRPPGAQRPASCGCGSSTRCAPGRPWCSSTPTATWSPRPPARARSARSRRRCSRSSPRYALRRGRRPVPAPPAPEPGALRYPAKASRCPAGRLLVADAGHHQLVELDGDGGRCAASAPAAAAAPTGRPGRPRSPSRTGWRCCPPGAAAFDVLVADTANHLLRGVRLADGAVVTDARPAAALAGASTVTGPVPAVLSPWDVAWWPALRPARRRRRRRAPAARRRPAHRRRRGAGRHHRGGAARRSGPRRLAGPAVRAGRRRRAGLVRRRRDLGAALPGHADATLHTAVGEGLFDFGHVDGPAGAARLQHPLGVALLPDGVDRGADTYNGAVRRYDPASRHRQHAGRRARRAVRSGARATASCSWSSPPPTAWSGRCRAARRSPARRCAPPGRSPSWPAAACGSTSRFVPAPGRELDERYGPATRLDRQRHPAGAAARRRRRRARAVPHARPWRPVPGCCRWSPRRPRATTQGEHPACYLARQDWGVPVRVGAAGSDALDLVLLG